MLTPGGEVFFELVVQTLTTALEGLSRVLVLISSSPREDGACWYFWKPFMMPDGWVSET